MTLYLILGQREIVDSVIIKDIEKVLIQKKSFETNHNVRLLLDNNEYVKDMTAILKGNWESEKSKIQEALNEQMENVNALQKNIESEANPDVRQLILVKCREEQRILSQKLNNLTGMEQRSLYNFSMISRICYLK